jgi:hypothetical protein
MANPNDKNRTVCEEMAEMANDITRKGLSFSDLPPNERIIADGIMEQAAALKTLIDTFSKEIQNV